MLDNGPIVSPECRGKFEVPIIHLREPGGQLHSNRQYVEHILKRSEEWLLSETERGPFPGIDSRGALWELRQCVLDGVNGAADDYFRYRVLWTW